MKKTKENVRGITLIALVVTIIVLLILAGVSLNLIRGSDGILGRATSAENTHDTSNAKEQADLFIADTLTAYYEEVYVDKTFSGSKLDYISDQIGNGAIIGDYFLKIATSGTAKVEKIQAVASLEKAYATAETLTELNIEVYRGNSSSGTKILEGTIDTNGNVSWNDELSQNAGGNDAPGTPAEDDDNTGPEITSMTGTLGSITVSAEDEETGVTGYVIKEDETKPENSEYTNWDGSSTTINVNNNTVSYLWVKNGDNITTKQKFQIHQHTGDTSKNEGCYTEPVYHTHDGNSTSGGNCYRAVTTNSTTNKTLYQKTFYGDWKVINKCSAPFSLDCDYGGTRYYGYGVWIDFEGTSSQSSKFTVRGFYWFNTSSEATSSLNGVSIGLTGTGGQGWFENSILGLPPNSPVNIMFSSLDSQLDFYGVPYEETTYELNCGKIEGETIESYSIGCGYTEGQLITY